MSSSLFPVPLEMQPKSRANQTFVQGQYRISIIDSGLVRVEVDSTGHFCDEATQAIINRSCQEVSMKVSSSNSNLLIETPRFKLTLNWSHPIESALSVEVYETGFIWHYGDEDEALPGTARTLDSVSGKTTLGKSVLSRKGLAVLDDSDSLLLDNHGWPILRAIPMIDIYIFAYGHDYQEALTSYYRISGKSSLIPRYILGNWWSKYWAYHDVDLLSIVDHFNEDQIPLSVCIVDMDWHITAIPGVQDYWAGWTGYTVNEKYFPDYKGFIHQLHQRGLRTSVNLHPAGGVKPYEVQYEAFAKATGHDPKTKLPIPFDSADPVHMKAYFEILLHPYEEQGVDFWWVDWQQGNTSKTAGLDPLWMLNHLHYYDSMRDGKRPFTFSRWSGKGAQRYPIGFSGDTVINWDSLAYQPYFTAMAANIGFGHWSHDIGGHMGGIEDPELYTRWIQLGCFSPILRMHSCSNLYAIREPWRYEEPYRGIISFYLRLRFRLIPYLYTEAWHATEHNRPLVRPLYHETPKDEKAYHQPNTTFFGSELVIHPVTEPINKETKRVLNRVYLPSGNRWIDFETGLSYDGGKTHSMVYGLNDLGIYAKEGAIIPMDHGPFRNDPTNPEVFQIHVFPGNNNTYTLYEDNGLAVNSKHFKKFLTHFSLIQLENQIMFTILHEGYQNIEHNKNFPFERSYQVIFHNIHGQIEGYEGHFDGQNTTINVPTTKISAQIKIQLLKVKLVSQHNLLLKVLDRFLVSLVLNHGQKTAIFEAIRDKKKGLPLKKSLEGLSKSTKDVVEALRKHPID